MRDNFAPLPPSDADGYIAMECAGGHDHRIHEDRLTGMVDAAHLTGAFKCGQCGQARTVRHLKGLTLVPDHDNPDEDDVVPFCNRH